MSGPSCAERLAGRVAIVTGATQGLGVDLARALARQGARVALVGRAREAGEAAAASIGPAAGFFECDITDDAAIDAVLAGVLARWGHLDALVNNACSYDDAGLASTRAQWLQTLNVNLVSAAVFTHKAAASMGPGSAIVNIGSTGGKFGAGGRAVYPASKAALLQLTRNFAVALAGQGIRVLSVSPAWTWSPAVAAMSGGSLEVADAVAAQLHPLGRVGRGEEVGRAVAFALSPEAGWMTGCDLAVDGGFSALGPDQGLPPRTWFERAASGTGP